jgi:hypothetical protein
MFGIFNLASIWLNVWSIARALTSPEDDSGNAAENTGKDAGSQLIDRHCLGACGACGLFVAAFVYEVNLPPPTQELCT